MHLLYLLLPAIAISCDDYWTYYNGHCYRRMSARGDVNQGHYMCRGFGANLLSVESDGEIEFVTDLTKTGNSAPIAMQTAIGAYRDCSTCPWKWRDGSAMTSSYRFRTDGPQSDGMCAYLITDKLVNPVKRGSTYSGDYWYKGATGFFVAGNCGNTGHIIICKKKDTTNMRAAKMCGPTWTVYSNSCYKKFSDPSIQIDQTNSYCKTHRSNLVTITSYEEKQVIIDMTRLGTWKYWGWQTVIGCYRTSQNSLWKWHDGTPFYQNSSFYHDMKNTGNCCHLFSDVSSTNIISPSNENIDFNSIYGGFCHALCNFTAFQFVCEKKACDLSVSTYSGGICTCNKGFIDVSETKTVEAANYKKGDKCVPEQCHVMEDTSILFMIDSSNSIGEEHWPKMMQFLQMASAKLPTTLRIGFLKFSTNVSEKKWLEPDWNVSQFKAAIPHEYEGGVSDTPLALKEARKMFDDIDSEKKIAVLITDGFPVTDDYDSMEEAHNATVKAAKELSEDDVRLTVMGFGPEICKGDKMVKEWVRDTKNDYFLLSHRIDNLGNADMDKLLKMVCR